MLYTTIKIMEYGQQTVRFPINLISFPTHSIGYGLGWNLPFGQNALIFVNPGVKITKDLREIPKEFLKPWKRSNFGNKQWVF